MPAMVRHCRCGVRGLSTPSTEKAFPRAPPQDIDYDDGCFIPAALNGNFTSQIGESLRTPASRRSGVAKSRGGPPPWTCALPTRGLCGPDTWRPDLVTRTEAPSRIERRQT